MPRNLKDSAGTEGQPFVITDAGVARAPAPDIAERFRVAHIIGEDDDLDKPIPLGLVLELVDRVMRDHIWCAHGKKPSSSQIGK